MDLHNDTVVNVAALLREPLGASRSYNLHLDQLTLDDGLVADKVDGSVKLTRLTDEILAAVTAKTVVELQCLRCLNQFREPVDVKFAEEFRIAYDVRTGTGIAPTEDDDERFEISGNHELDFGEALRQEIIVALPMRPACGDQCPGPDLVDETAGTEPAVDHRLAALGALLEESEES